MSARFLYSTIGRSYLAGKLDFAAILDLIFYNYYIKKLPRMNLSGAYINLAIN